MKNSEKEKYVEMMEMKTNKASNKIIHILNEEGLEPNACIVSMLKAAAIVMESYAHVGGNADPLEAMVKEMIGPARKEARRFIDRSGMPEVFDKQPN